MKNRKLAPPNRIDTTEARLDAAYRSHHAGRRRVDRAVQAAIEGSREWRSQFSIRRYPR